MALVGVQNFSWLSERLLLHHSVLVGFSRRRSSCWSTFIEHGQLRLPTRNFEYRQVLQYQVPTQLLLIKATGGCMLEDHDDFVFPETSVVNDAPLGKQVHCSSLSFCGVGTLIDSRAPICMELPASLLGFLPPHHQKSDVTGASHAVVSIYGWVQMVQTAPLSL